MDEQRRLADRDLADAESAADSATKTGPERAHLHSSLQHGAAPDRAEPRYVLLPLEPDVGRRSAASRWSRQRPVVVLPQPLSPTRREEVSPSPMVKLTSSTARTPPEVLDKILDGEQGGVMAASAIASCRTATLRSPKAAPLISRARQHALSSRPGSTLAKLLRRAGTGRWRKEQRGAKAAAGQQMGLQVRHISFKRVQPGARSPGAASQSGNRLKQAARVRMERPGKQTFHIGLLHDLPGVHDGDLMRPFLRPRRGRA